MPQIPELLRTLDGHDLWCPSFSHDRIHFVLTISEQIWWSGGLENQGDCKTTSLFSVTISLSMCASAQIFTVVLHTSLASRLSNIKSLGQSLYRSPIAFSRIFLFAAVLLLSNSSRYPVKISASSGVTWNVFIFAGGRLTGPEGISRSPETELEFVSDSIGDIVNDYVADSWDPGIDVDWQWRMPVQVVEHEDWPLRVHIYAYKYHSICPTPWVYRLETPLAFGNTVKMKDTPFNLLVPIF